MDVPCAVSRDLANYEAQQARWELACESFDENVFDIASEEIDKAAEALTELADAIVAARIKRNLECYEDNEYEGRIREALELVEG